MNRQKAIKILETERDEHINGQGVCYATRQEAVNMAIDALQKLSYITDRPCQVCKFNPDGNGCKKWTCVFEDGKENV